MAIVPVAAPTLSAEETPIFVGGKLAAPVRLITPAMPWVTVSNARMSR